MKNRRLGNLEGKISFMFFFFHGTEDQTQDLMLAKQALVLLSRIPWPTSVGEQSITTGQKYKVEN